MQFIPYPLLCKPLLVPKIWGGTQLWEVFQKGEAESTQIGESWELSTVKGAVSTIENGAYAGESLQAVLDQFPAELLGESVHAAFGTQFPLLVKYIDAKEDLSVQVHPNDELAQKRHQTFGKTEMWYLVQAEAGSRIIAGLDAGVNEQTFKQAVKDKRVMEVLKNHPAIEGQVYFLPTGTVHAIGGGVLLAEIQQTSDITYRIYDFDRLDDQGQLRELHVDLAYEAIDYAAQVNPTQSSSRLNQAVTLVQCPYFTTDLLELNGQMKQNTNGSFKIFMCVNGEFTLQTAESEWTFTKGNTVLVPAQLGAFEINGDAKLLSIRVN